MNASRYEQEFAQTRGVTLRHLVDAPQTARIGRPRTRDASSNPRVSEPTANSPARANLRARGGHGVQGDRAEGARGNGSPTPPKFSSCSRTASWSTRSGKLRCPACGPAAIAFTAAGPHRLRRAGRQARRTLHRPLSEGEVRNMADLTTTFLGINSPNPFWLASAPPTDKAYNVNRAFEAGWGGVGLEDARRRSADRQREWPALRRDPRQRPPRARLQQHRAHHRPAARRQPRRRSARSSATGPTAR